MSKPLYSRVLIPVEFTRASEDQIKAGEAVEVAAGNWVWVNPGSIAAVQLAARMAPGGDLTFVHATALLGSGAIYGGPEGMLIASETLAELDRAAAERARKVLGRIAAIHCEGTMVHYEIGPGRSVELILGAAKERRAEAIVMAASSRGMAKRALLGSTAGKIVRRSECPVTVIPSG